MKRASKGFILIGTIAIAIGIGTLFKVTTPIKEQIEKESAKTYSHNPNNILDNVFLDGNNIILPFIFDDPDTTIKAEQIKSEFSKKGLTVKNIATPEAGSDVGTGTKITVEENSNVYNVIVYGDVDGDGIVDLIDAQNIILHALEDKTLRDFYAKAAKVSDNYDEINLIDAQRVILFCLGSPLEPARLVVDEPSSNNQAPVITLKGKNPDKVKYGDAYTDPSATVADITDKNVKLETVGKIDTSKLGNQTITYKAKNFSGKETIVTRTVTVVDYVKSIQITPPNKTNYVEGEKLDLTGGKVILVKASGTNQETIDMAASGVTVSSYDANGKVTVTYTYKDPITAQSTKVTANFTVTVKPVNHIASIRVEPPTKTEYRIGDTVLTDGMKVIATRREGQEEEIPLTDANLTITVPTPATLSNKTIKVVYIDKKNNNKKYEESIELTVLRKEISTINIKTEKMINGVPQSGTQGDLRTEFKLTLTSGKDEKDIPVDQIKWIVTDNKNGNATIASSDTQGPDDDIILTKTDSEKQADGTVAITMNFKALKEGSYKITVSLDGKPDIKGETNIEIIPSSTVNEITLDQANTVLSAETSGVRTLSQNKLIPIEFKHYYPDGEKGILDLSADQLEIGLTENGNKIDWATVKLYADEDTESGETGSVNGIKLIATQAGTVELTLKASNVTQKYTIKIEPSAVIPLISENGLEKITFYSEAKPGSNGMVQKIDGEDAYVSLLPIALTDGTHLIGSNINSSEYNNETGSVTIESKNKDKELVPDNLYILFYNENKVLIDPYDPSWADKEVWYVGLYAYNSIIEGSIVISYETQEINVDVMGEVTTMDVTVTGETISGSTIQRTLKPYGVFELVLGQKDGEEDIPISNIEWTVMNTNNNQTVASGEGTKQLTGYTNPKDDIRTERDFIKLTKAPIGGNMQLGGKAVKMSLKVLQAGNYKMTVTLKEYSSSVKGEINFKVEEDNTVNGLLLEESDALKKAEAGKGYDYELTKNEIIPITYVHEYIDEETNKKVPEVVSDAEVAVEKLGVQLKDTGEEDWINYRLYFAENTEAGTNLGVRYIKLNANKEGTVTVALTLNGVTKNYKIHINPDAAIPVLQVIENGQKIETIKLYADETDVPDDKTLVGEYNDGMDTYYLSLIPVSFTDGSRLQASEINSDEYAIDNGRVTVTCKDENENLIESNLFIQLYDENKVWIDVDDADWSLKKVGYIGVYAYDSNIIANGWITVSCEGMEPINLKIIQ